MTDRVSLTVKDHVAYVSLNRPDKYNAVDRAMFDALIATGQAVGADPEVRAVVLAGEGKHFCAGIDTSVFMGGGIDPALMQPQAGSDANYFQRAATIWREIDVPVVAALHGICYGAGLQIAFGADIRVATPGCELSIMEVKWGIIPDMGMTVTAAGLLRPDHLKELTMTGRVVPASEGLGYGLVSMVDDDPKARAKAIATDIARRSPDATATAKTLLNQTPRLSAADALALEASLQMTLLGSANQQEAVKANMERRPPEFAARQA